MLWQNNSDRGNNPWDQGGGRGDNPWRNGGPQRGGGGGGGGGPQGPDFDDIIRRMQDRLRASLPSGMGGARGIAILALVFIGLWLLSGIYTVQPGFQGVVTTFGRFAGVAEEGLNYRLPWPIQAVEKVSIQNVFETRIDGSLREGRTRRGSTSTLMLTGDENIVDISFTILWRISNPEAYLFNIQSPQEDTVRVAAESSLRDVIGRSTLQNALTTGKSAIASETEQLLQRLLDTYGAGVAVQEVQLQRIDPPADVIEAFQDVQAAEADRVRVQNQAEQYRNRVVPEARGEAQRMLQQAEAYKQQIIARAQGEAQRFLSVYEEYKKAEDVTRKRIYLETMEEILDGMDKIILDSDSGQGVVPYLPLDQLNKAGTRRGGAQ